MSQATKPGRPARRGAAPEISLVPKPEPTQAEAGKPQSAESDGVTPPKVTLDDPWRHLHPSRVWPD